MNEVLFELDGGVATIRLNRPESFNALNEAMGLELVRGIERCFDPGIRAVVLTGTGKAFCSGGDLQAMKNIGAENLPGFLRELTKLLHRLITDIRLLPKPVVAAINGPMGGAGFSMALACDLRFAVAGSRFRQSYTSVGLCPDGGFTALLPAMVGLSKASEFLFLDPVITAEQAKELGIVHDVFNAEEFWPGVNLTAKRLSAGATGSYAKAKALLNSMLLPNLEKQLELERQGIIDAGASSDGIEGIGAFLAKRTPNYTGR